MTQITQNNIQSYPVGTKVHYNGGPFGGIKNGEVIAHGSDRFYSAYLIVAFGENDLTNVFNIVNKGIGIHLGHSDFEWESNVTDDDISTWCD
jgi:hypothetical protein